jgi:cytochrome P450
MSSEGGEYVWKVEDMHKRYGELIWVLAKGGADRVGPIVRIRPDILHVNDPEYLDQVFGTAGKRRDKYKLTTNGLAAPGAAIVTVEHDLHRSRRAPLNPYFSKQSIQRLEPILQRTWKKVLECLVRNAKSGEPMRMQLLYAATTSDIISDYCFGQSYNNLDREDLKEPYFTAFTEGVRGYYLLSTFSWLPSLMRALPLRLAIFLFPLIKGAVKEIRVSAKISFNDLY